MLFFLRAKPPRRRPGKGGGRKPPGRGSYVGMPSSKDPRKKIIKNAINKITDKKPTFKSRSSYVAALYFNPLWELLRNRIPAKHRAEARQLIKDVITIGLDARDLEDNFRISKARLLRYLQQVSFKDEELNTAVADMFARLKEHPYNLVSTADFFILYGRNVESAFEVLKEVFSRITSLKAEELKNTLKKFGIPKKEYDMLIGKIEEVLKERQSKINYEFDRLVENLPRIFTKDAKFKKQAIEIWKLRRNAKVRLLMLFSGKMLDLLFDTVARHVRTPIENMNRVKKLIGIYFCARTPSLENMRIVFSHMAKISRDASLKESFRSASTLLKQLIEEKKGLEVLSEKTRADIEMLLNYAKVYLEPLIKERLSLLFGSYGHMFYAQIVENCDGFYREEIIPAIKRFLKGKGS